MGSSAELLEILAKAIVVQPDRVRVSEERHQAQVTLLLEVSAEDVGRVIGREGRIIKAIRKVIRTTGGPEGRHLVVEVVAR